MAEPAEKGGGKWVANGMGLPSVPVAGSQSGATLGEGGLSDISITT